MIEVIPDKKGFTILSKAIDYVEHDENYYVLTFPAVSKPKTTSS